MAAASSDADNEATTSLSPESLPELITQHHGGLLRLARMWTPDRATAEEAVQEVWVAFLEGRERFAGRSSLRTWLCAILVNVVRARVRKERRSLPVSAIGQPDRSTDYRARTSSEPGSDDYDESGSWSAYPCARPDPEAATLRAELRAVLRDHLQTLPEAQREVLVLRDVEGLSGAEVCSVLGIRPSHQRVLLHRARTALRVALGMAWHPEDRNDCSNASAPSAARTRSLGDFKRSIPLDSRLGRAQCARESL